jgi:hypothetical protein
MESDGSLPCLQNRVTFPYKELDQSTPHLHPISWRYVLISSFYLRLSLPSFLFPSEFPTQALNAPLLCPLHATCPARPIYLDFITRTTFGKEYRSWNCLLYSLLPSSFLGPDISLGCIFSNSLMLHSSFDVWDQIHSNINQQDKVYFCTFCKTWQLVYYHVGKPNNKYRLWSIRSRKALVLITKLFRFCRACISRCASGGSLDEGSPLSVPVSPVHYRGTMRATWFRSNEAFTCIRCSCHSLYYNIPSCALVYLIFGAYRYVIYTRTLAHAHTHTHLSMTKKVLIWEVIYRYASLNDGDTFWEMRR